MMSELNRMQSRKLFYFCFYVEYSQDVGGDQANRQWRGGGGGIHYLQQGEHIKNTFSIKQTRIKSS